MKCLVISPKNGTIRISRFTTVEVQSSPEPHARPENDPAGSFGDLNKRHAAPLRLSEALQARLDRGTRRKIRIHRLRRN